MITNALLVIRIFLDVNMSYSMPKGVIFIDFVLSFSILSAIRILLRLYRERLSLGDFKIRSKIKNVAIIGAGHVGGSLARDLFARRSLGMRPVYYFDDDSTKWGSRLHDIPVLGAPELIKNED